MASSLFFLLLIILLSVKMDAESIVREVPHKNVMATMKIAAKSWPPMVNPCSLNTLSITKDCLNPGMYPEMLGYLLQLAKIPYQLIPFENNEWDQWGSVDQHGNATGLLALVQSGAIDTVSAAYLTGEDRTQHFDFSYPVDYSHLVFLLHKSERSFSDSALLAFKVFKWPLWAVLLTALFMLMHFAAIQARLLPDEGNSKTESQSLFSFLQLFLQQAHRDLRSRHFSRNVTFLLLSYLSLVILNLYQGMLLGHLITNRHKPADDILSLLESGHYRLGFSSTTPLVKILTRPNTSNAERYRKVLAKYPPLMYSNEESRLKALLSPEGKRLVLPSSLEIVAKSFFNRSCQLTTLYDNYYFHMFAFIFRKGSPWPAILQQSIIRLLTMRKHFHHRASHFDRTCGNRDPTSIIRKPMKIYTLSGAFMMMLIGLTLGIVAVFVEKIYSIYSTNRQRKNEASRASTRNYQSGFPVTGEQNENVQVSHQNHGCQTFTITTIMFILELDYERWRSVHPFFQKILRYMEKGGMEPLPRKRRYSANF